MDECKMVESVNKQRKVPFTVSSSYRVRVSTSVQTVITSAEEGGYVFSSVLSVCLFVCLSVRRITRKLVNGF